MTEDMAVQVRNVGFGTEGTYVIQLDGVWVPCTRDGIDKLLRGGAIIYWNQDRRQF